MFEQTFKNIDDILHKDAGCGRELDYVEQTSWVLFLKYRDTLEKSNLFDVLEYDFNADSKNMSRAERVSAAHSTIFAILNKKQKEFISFVLSKYVETGVEELDQDKLPILLTNKYQSLNDAKAVLGEVKNISAIILEFKKYLWDWRKSAFII